MHELIGGVRPLAWTQMTFGALALLGIVYQKNCKIYIDFCYIIEKEMDIFLFNTIS